MLVLSFAQPRHTCTRSKCERVFAPDVAALHRKGSLTLERLEHARLGSPRDPTLTAPERELLAAFQLNTMDAVRQRMHERAMLAAYDGAPSALTEMRIEQAPASMGDTSVPSRPQKLPDTRQEAQLETTLSYDPDTLRASLRYMVTWRQVEQLADGQPLETQRAPSMQYHSMCTREG